MANFTTENLLQYIYGEATNAAAIEAAIMQDWGLCEKYRVLANAHGKLNTLFLSPRKQSVNFILQLAAAKQKSKV
jgi:hypothetical protein